MVEPGGEERKVAETKEESKSTTTPITSNNAKPTSNVKDSPTTASTSTDSKKATTAPENKIASAQEFPNESMDGSKKGTEETQAPVKMANTTTSNPTDRESSPTTSKPSDSSTGNTGSDRVTIDKPKRPLLGDNASTTAPTASLEGKKESTSWTTSLQNNVVAFPSASTLSGHSTGHGISLHSTSPSAINQYQQQHLSLPMPGMQVAIIGNLGQPVVASVPPTRPGMNTQSYSSHSPHEFTDEDVSAASDAEEIIRRQRAPLADKYAPYIAPSDTSLDDARHRLRIALDQTRQLRAAFTERVYGKYRICLKPPSQTEEIIETLEKDPGGMFKKIQSEIRRVKAAKELEKKEIQKLNNEANATSTKMSADNSQDGSVDASGSEKASKNPFAAMNADSAEQLMYVTAGLSLIVLPEANASNIDMSMYSDRGPVDVTTGHRVRGISAASASAGEIMIDRARRALTMKVEREQRGLQQQQSAANLIQQENFENNYSKGPSVQGAGASYVSKQAMSLPVSSFSTDHTPASGDQKKAAVRELEKAGVNRAVNHGSSSRSGVIHSGASAKAIRARVQATMSMTTLLSLNPIHEELRNDNKYSPSTLAMMELGVGNQATQTVQYHKNTPHRFKHPFPDSLGGRRRPISGINSANLLLPPAPTYKERRRFKDLPTVSPKEASNLHAKRAIGNILEKFAPPYKKRRITEIEFLHGLSSERTAKNPNRPGQEFDSTLALNVMKAVGIVASSTTDKTTDRLHGPSTLVSSLFDLEKMITAGVCVDSGPLCQSLERLKVLESGFSGCLRLTAEWRGESEVSNGKSSVQDPDRTPETEVLHIRGGGGDAVKTSSQIRKESTSNSSQPKTDSTRGGGASNQNPQKGSSSSICSSGNLQNNPGNATGGGFQSVLWDEQRQQPIVLLQSPMLGNSGGIPQGRNGQMQQQMEHYHQTNALQLANQLRMSRLPNHGQSGGGDLVDYLGGLHQQQAAYDWSAAVASSQSLAALGMNQQQARAFLTREHQTLAHAAQQQAAAMLGGAAAGGHPYFAGQMLNPAAAAALTGHSGMQRLQGGPQNQGAKNQNQAPQQSVQKPQAQKATHGDKRLHDVQPTYAKDEKSGDEKKQALSSSAGIKRMPSTATPSKDVPPSKQIRSLTATDARSSQPKPNGTTSNNSTLRNPRGPSADKKKLEPGKQEVSKMPAGLQFFVPPTPAEISSQVASKILAGKFHETIKSMQGVTLEEGGQLVSFVIAVGTAVPIPKAMVMQRLKDRMNNASLKNNPAGGIPVSSREVIAAVIMLWLWRNNENSFQKAFTKSGRIDVDSECKWFVDAAVHKAVSALSDQLAEESSSRTVGPFTSALIAHRNKSSVDKDPESIKASASKVDVLASFIVSRSLNMTFTLNGEMDDQLPIFHDRVKYLDEARRLALYSKSQERALLASVVSRKATMSFSFSHSYVSAIVRAGEALGHGSLFEAVQNEKFGVSTMIPYDVFTDESYAWEDPCRPAIGFTEGLTGDEMMRRAHARAMIQKSLKKLQERHNVKGGTPIPGPYVDQNASSSATPTSRSGTVTPRGSLQRRRSFSEVQFQQGSGSAAATNPAVYDPKHTCPPLEWATAIENSPYGRHNKRTIPRSLSSTQGAAVMRQAGRSGKASRRRSSSRQRDSQVAVSLSPNDGKKGSDGARRSTREIPWKDVAGIFQQVQMPGTLKEKKDLEAKKFSVKDRTIFAPVVKKLSFMPIIDREDSSDEEDLSDEAVLGRHQVVLNEMKIKLTAIQESRKKSMDRRKSRDKSHE